MELMTNLKVLETRKAKFTLCVCVCACIVFAIKANDTRRHFLIAEVKYHSTAHFSKLTHADSIGRQENDTGV